MKKTLTPKGQTRHTENSQFSVVALIENSQFLVRHLIEGRFYSRAVLIIKIF